MAINLRQYISNNKYKINLKLHIFQLLTAFIATSMIYIINTYWYQQSKKNVTQVISNNLIKSIQDTNASNIGQYINDITNLVNESHLNTKIVLYDFKNGKKIQIIPYKHISSDDYFSRYYQNIQNFTIKQKFGTYNIEYQIKKRLGNHPVYDLFPASNFSILVDKNIIDKYNLYQKSWIFYTYFVVIYLGLFFFSRKYKSMKDDIENQEKEFSILETRYFQEVKKLKDDNLDLEQMLEIRANDIHIVKDKAHLGLLKNSILEVNDKIYILSGWISSYVIDEGLIFLFEKALERGVEIYIGFGWDTKEGGCSNLSLLKDDAQNVFQDLIKLKEKYNGNRDTGSLYLGYFPNHQKILLKDDEYIVCGSNNWLSNGAFNKSELSLKVYSKDIIDVEKKRLEELISRYSVNECA